MSFNHRSRRKPPKPGKLKELALYYNLAVDRIILLLNYFQHTPLKDEDFWKGKFYRWKKQDEQGKKEINFETFAFLKNYLFYKEILEQHSSTVTGLDDKQLLVAMVEKLFNLRNWHSHYCHKHGILYFNDLRNGNNEEGGVQRSLEEFLTSHLEMAAEKSIKDDLELKEYFNNELKKSFTLFEKGRITQEGRIFFLQFFLTVGEMNKCLSGISGFKRNKSPYWQLKRKIFSFYSKRDGSSTLAFIFKSNEQTEGKQSVEVKNQLRQFSVFNEIKEYLIKKPAILCTNFEIEQWRNRNEQEENTTDKNELQDTIRPVNRFMYYGLQYLLDFETKLGFRNRIEWRFRDTMQEKITTEKEGKYNTKVKNKPVFGSRSYAAERLFIKNGMAYFRFVVEDKTFLCSINEQGLLYWIGAILLNLNKTDSIVKDILAYVRQYSNILDNLKNGKDIDLSKYPKIKQEFLHEKLVNWINKKDEQYSEKEYKHAIKNRIQSVINELNSLTLEKLLQMKAVEKNRLLLKWYNYVLTTDNKLSHVKDGKGRFSELDNLSRFHYMPVNYEGKLRAHLLNNFKYKFPQYVTEALFAKNHKNIDDIVIEMVPFVKSVFCYWKRITDDEKHPPEWQNTNLSPEQLLNQPTDQWSSMGIDDWNSLARKLNISNPFLTKVRNGSREADRKKELLDYYNSVAIQIPKSVFIDDDSITSVSDSNKTHKSFAKQIRESPLATGLLNEFYDIKSGSDLPKILAAEKPGYSPGAIIKEILYTKTTDALLWGICLEYHNKLFTAGKISSESNANVDYSTVTVFDIGEHRFNWVIGGKTITIKQKQLRKMIFDYKLKEIEKIISRGLISENTAEALEKIFTDNYFNSLRFIQRVLELEEAVLGECSTDKNYNQGSYIDFEKVLEKVKSVEIIDSDKVLLKELRNTAFHTKIPSRRSFEDGIKIIETFLNKSGFPFIPFKTE
jgi:hypothetical protein